MKYRLSFLRIISITFLLSVMLSCKTKPKADAIYFNGTVYTVDSNFSTATSFALKDGKIIEVGDNNLKEKYDAASVTDLKGQFVYPGFIDAHCHFYGYGVDLKKINLTGTKSWNDAIDSLLKHKDQKFEGWIFGRGWDQNDWEVKEYPDKKMLDSLFPDVPVFAMRIDGHAAVVNQMALDLAGYTVNTKISGGELEIKNGKLTGLLIDNAVDTLKKTIPLPSRVTEIEALLSAQKNCFAVGLTTVDDAGIDASTVNLIDSIQKLNLLKMRYYAMITYDAANKKYFFEKGKIKTDRLNVRSFKIYADGSLGSRGAMLLAPYADKPDHIGLLLSPYDSIKNAAQEIATNGFQMCTHCIGDSGVRMMLNIYGEATKNITDARWRIEHAQVVNKYDFELFGKYKVIPSVQPTHATSDMYWAADRIGAERVKGAYAYKQLMQQNNMIAAGSDFPVEDINPLYGFYAAVVRKDQKNFPDEGFQLENVLTREHALRAMTIWAAYANFEETEKGSLEAGKFADFVILKEDLMKAEPEKLWSIKVQETYVNGEKVF